MEALVKQHFAPIPGVVKARPRPSFEVPDHPDWPGGEDVTLADFFEAAASDPGTLAFVDVLERPECLGLAVEVLREQVLPWFEALHAG